MTDWVPVTEVAAFRGMFRSSTGTAGQADPSAVPCRSYFLTRNDISTGPYTREMIETGILSGKLLGTDFASLAGDKNWVPLNRMADFAALFIVLASRPPGQQPVPVDRPGGARTVGRGQQAPAQEEFVFKEMPVRVKTPFYRTRRWQTLGAGLVTVVLVVLYLVFKPQLPGRKSAPRVKSPRNR